MAELEKLAGLQCTHAEMAAWFGCSTKTIQRHLKEDGTLAEAVDRGQGKGLISLRRTQFRLSEKNAAMAIFLGKQYLGQSDKQDVNHGAQDSLGALLDAVNGRTRGLPDRG